MLKFTGRYCDGAGVHHNIRLAVLILVKRTSIPGLRRMEKEFIALLRGLLH